jgi:predicted amidohydrolase
VQAPAQISGPAGEPAFGRSVVVDPWGTVVAEAPDTVAIIYADLDLDRVDDVRRQIPVLAGAETMVPPRKR